MTVYSAFGGITADADEAELELLMAATDGSRFRQLADMPVTLREWPRGVPILLPPHSDDDNKVVVVVPVEARGASVETKWWNCIVVHSTDDRYPVGGHDVIVSAAEIRRGRKVAVTLD